MKYTNQKCQLCGESIPVNYVHRPNGATVQGLSCKLVPISLATQDDDIQAAFNQDLDDIKRDIAKHGVAY